MKQKTSASETLTKKDLIDVLKDFRKEFREEIQIDIKNEIKASEMRMLTKLDELELRLEDSARKRHSDVLTRFDTWAGEIEAAREDRVITTKQLKDHEKRIEALEKAQN